MATKNNNGANLGFENQLWAAADKMRGHMDASEYKHVVLGLIFLKYISDAFQTKYIELKATKESKYTDPEDRDEYAAANEEAKRSLSTPARGVPLLTVHTATFPMRRSTRLPVLIMHGGAKKTLASTRMCRVSVRTPPLKI